MIENSYSIELDPLDISPYRRGNTGIDYITTIDSGQPGPHVMINAIVHGNELCGVVALDFLFRNKIVPTRGKLTLSFANTAAYLTFDPENPNDSRFVDEDFNRVWDIDKLEGVIDSTERNRAREMRPIVDQVDYLLDLHSLMHDTPALLLSGALRKGKDLAFRLKTPEYVIKDYGHSAGRRLRDYGHFADTECSENSLLVECGQHWKKSTGQTAIETSLGFLHLLQMLAPELAAQHLTPRQYPQQKFIEITEAVTIQTTSFQFVKEFEGMEIFSDAGTLIATEGDLKILTPYDNCILIMPSKRISPGLTAVRFGRIS